MKIFHWLWWPKKCVRTCKFLKNLKIYIYIKILHTNATYGIIFISEWCGVWRVVCMRLFVHCLRFCSKRTVFLFLQLRVQCAVCTVHCRRQQKRYKCKHINSVSVMNAFLVHQLYPQWFSLIFIFVRFNNNNKKKEKTIQTQRKRIFMILSMFLFSVCVTFDTHTMTSYPATYCCVREKCEKRIERYRNDCIFWMRCVILSHK